MKKYNYLKKFINNSAAKHPRNSFTMLKLEEITNAENKLNFKFPNVLKEFWHEIGTGVFNLSINGKDAWDYANYILSPKEIASIILEEDDAPIIPYVREYFQEGDIPFFEIMDSTDFLIMKKDSLKPDMVYDMSGGEIDHFEKFIWRLYHESPTYYEAIISKNLEKEKQSCST